MLMDGHTLQVRQLEAGFFNVVFNHKEEAVNTLSQKAMAELAQALEQIKQQSPLNGVVFSSDKEAFIVGADITEFHAMFEHDEGAITQSLLSLHEVFNTIEDLPCPTVCAINGLALGGGFELALSTDYRVVSESAKVGLPEVKLGIYPGWGGTVRLPRLIGIDNANEWICAGSDKKAAAAFKDGAVDAVVKADHLAEAALDLVKRCANGEFDYQARRDEKTSAVKLNAIELMMAFETAKGVIGAKAGPHYPAPMMAIKTMQKAVTLPRAKAQEVEAKNFAKLATNSVTKALVGLFLKDQFVKRVSKQYEAGTDAVKQAAVLGAGIMGGGVAYQSASKGVPILMKDIRQEALALGLSEATQLLEKQVSRGKLDTKGMANVLNQITPTLSFGDFEPVDLVVEAVVENPKIKASVLADLEANVSDDAIITSNTSTISINSLAKSLKKPERFCGMHFFNPVHRMPLVEVIRGEHSSDAAIAKTVAYAKAMGKTPIVVNDCAGFLVNRVLFPYFAGFSQLVSEGVDFQRIDKVMEGFGWPMGPAYLLDVVGLDTAAHADQVMADAFPDRMGHEGQNAIDLLFAANRLGQKNKQGFYQYELDRKGKLQKKADSSVYELIGLDPSQSPEITDEKIIARMMIPLCVETVRCLEEKIVASPAEADMALIYGIGFPPFRGGVFHYLDEMGLGTFCEMAAPFDAMGPLYQPTAVMKSMAEHGQTYGLTGRGQ